jgi:hypothetical protein
MIAACPTGGRGRTSSAHHRLWLPPTGRTPTHYCGSQTDLPTNRSSLPVYHASSARTCRSHTSTCAALLSWKPRSRRPSTQSLPCLSSPAHILPRTLAVTPKSAHHRRRSRVRPVMALQFPSEKRVYRPRLPRRTTQRGRCGTATRRIPAAALILAPKRPSCQEIASMPPKPDDNRKEGLVLRMISTGKGP